MKDKFEVLWNNNVNKTRMFKIDPSLNREQNQLMSIVDGCKQSAFEIFEDMYKDLDFALFVGITACEELDEPDDREQLFNLHEKWGTKL